MSGSAFITGNSSGIGLGFTEVLLARGYRVYGLSRRGCPIQHPGLRDRRCDLGDLEGIPAALDELLEGLNRLDLVVMNAGLLGQIQSMRETGVATLEHMQRINVWSNKCILDWFIDRAMSVDQILLMSSGAAVNGSFGWGGYALSKATLNMLTQLYAHELPESQLIAFAPGLVDTAMQDYLCESVDSDRFPSVQKLKAARGTDSMPSPHAAAERIVELLPRLKASVSSGDFVDIRAL